MSNPYKTVSCKVIIANIYRTLRPNRPLPINDIIHFIDEASQDIGIGCQIVDKTAEITVSSHRGEIPCDLHQLKGISYNGLPLMYGSQIYDNVCDTSQFSETNTVGFRALTRDTFTINGRFFNTTFESGTIYAFYRAYETDQEGLPVIPDDFAFQRACLWYTLWNLMVGGFEPNSSSITLAYAEMQWIKYRTQAENESKMRNLRVNMESFSRNWLRWNSSRPNWNNFWSNDSYGLDSDSSHPGNGMLLLDPNYDIPYPLT